MSTVSSLGVPTSGLRRETAVIRNVAFSGASGGGGAVPTSSDGSVRTVELYKIYKQTAVLGAVANSGTATAWFRIMPDVNAIKIWIDSADAAPDLSFVVSDEENGTEYITSTLTAQTGTSGQQSFLITELEGVAWIKVTYTNNSGGAITPTAFFCTQSTAMAPLIV